MTEKSASAQIDDIIANLTGWKADILTQVRSVIKAAEADVVEEIKWKMANRPEGLAVWSHDGILCFAEIWKDNIKLLFPKGADLKDSKKLFNARLLSKGTRAIEFREDSKVDEADLKALVAEAVEFNESK